MKEIVMKKLQENERIYKYKNNKQIKLGTSNNLLKMSKLCYA